MQIPHRRAEETGRGQGKQQCTAQSQKAVQTSGADKGSGDRQQVSRAVFSPLCFLQSPLVTRVVKAS